jgi:hypothetical protein
MAWTPVGDLGLHAESSALVSPFYGEMAKHDRVFSNLARHDKTFEESLSTSASRVNAANNSAILLLSHTCIRKPYLLSVYHWPENATCLTDVENQMPTVGSGLGLDDSIRASERWWTMEKESLLSHQMPCRA